MELIANLPEFIAAVFLLAMLPGQGTAMILRQTLLFGRSTGAITVFFYTLGFTIWSVLSAIGLASIFTQNENAYKLLKYIGVSYLIFLSVQGLTQLFKNSSKFDFTELEKRTQPNSIKIGLTTSLTNVKAAVIAVAFIPTFVPVKFDLALGIILLGIIWSLTSMSWYFFLVFSVGKASEFFSHQKSRKFLTLFSSFGLLILAILLSIS
jgi:threonine/homoserine/homoserine lactone efflux protein